LHASKEIALKVSALSPSVATRVHFSNVDQRTQQELKDIIKTAEGYLSAEKIVNQTYLPSTNLFHDNTKINHNSAINMR